MAHVQAVQLTKLSQKTLHSIKERRIEKSARDRSSTLLWRSCKSMQAREVSSFVCAWSVLPQSAGLSLEAASQRLRLLQRSRPRGRGIRMQRYAQYETRRKADTGNVTQLKLGCLPRTAWLRACARSESQSTSKCFAGPSVNAQCKHLTPQHPPRLLPNPKLPNLHPCGCGALEN